MNSIQKLIITANTHNWVQNIFLRPVYNVLVYYNPNRKTIWLNVKYTIWQKNYSNTITIISGKKELYG